MRIAFLGFLMLIVAGSKAAACPAGSQCLKYRTMRPPLEKVMTYRRATRALPPRFDRKRIAELLTSSQWIPQGTQRAPILVFALASRVRRAVPSPGTRVVLIREIEQRMHTTYVNIDGDYFALVRCSSSDLGRPNTACLNRVDALPEEPPTAEDLHEFAQPPP